MRTVVVPVLLALLLLAAGPAAASEQTDQCLTCHEEAFQSKEARTVLSEEASPHAALDCLGCHSDASEFPHEVKPGKVDCATCHAEAAEEYAGSVHGQKAAAGDGRAANCTTCHGRHDVRRVDDPASRVYPLNLPATCGTCHAGGTPRRHEAAVPDAFAQYLESAHGKGLLKSGLLVSASCNDCHGGHAIQPAGAEQSRLSRKNVPATCGTCHAGIEAAYRSGIHGQLWSRGDEQVPVCTTCHTSHGVTDPKDPQFQLDAIGGCGNCHAHEIETYRETYHGQVTALGFVAVAKCADCHRYHDVLPSKDADSATNPQHLEATCGKCHAGANANFVKFEPHGDHTNKDRFPHLYYTYLFMTTLLTGTFVFFGLHSLLWLFRSLRERGRRTHGEP